MALNVEEIDKKYNLRPFIDGPVTKIDVDPLVLDSIDLSLFQEGDEYLHQRTELAKRIEKSVSTYGFFNLVNFGISPDTIARIRSIGQSLLSIPDKEKLQYLASAPTKEEEKPGNIGGERGNGFKPKGYWSIKNGVRDSIDLYNFHINFQEEFLKNPEKYPIILQAHLKEVSDYYKYIHQVILPKLLRLFDLLLEIPEGTIANHYFKHAGTPQDPSWSNGRLMVYRPYDDAKSSEGTGNMFLRGHSDLNALTFITSQPILGLQIKDVYSGNWRYVSHRPDSLIVNVGDSLEFITGGYFRAALHRVIEPPADQLAFERLVLIYFLNPANDAILDPDQLESAKLTRLGFSKHDKLKGWEKIAFHTWNDSKGKTIGLMEAGKRNETQVHGRYIERWHIL